MLLNLNLILISVCTARRWRHSPAHVCSPAVTAGSAVRTAGGARPDMDSWHLVRLAVYWNAAHVTGPAGTGGDRWGEVGRDGGRRGQRDMPVPSGTERDRRGETGTGGGREGQRGSEGQRGLDRNSKEQRGTASEL